MFPRFWKTSELFKGTLMHMSFGKGSDLAKCRRMPVYPVQPFFSFSW